MQQITKTHLFEIASPSKRVIFAQECQAQIDHVEGFTG
jgi:hypothetical protein